MFAVLGMFVCVVLVMHVVDLVYFAFGVCVWLWWLIVCVFVAFFGFWCGWLL